MQIQLHSLCRAKTCICGLKIEPFTNIQLGTQIHIQQNIKVLKNLFHFSIFNTFRQFKDKSTWGAWIAEWYYTWFLVSLRCAMPWALSSSLGNNKLFFGPKHNINSLFMILLGLFDLILLFVYQICHVNCETVNWK